MWMCVIKWCRRRIKNNNIIIYLRMYSKWVINFLQMPFRRNPPPTDLWFLRLAPWNSELSSKSCNTAVAPTPSFRFLYTWQIIGKCASLYTHILERNYRKKHVVVWNVNSLFMKREEEKKPVFLRFLGSCLCTRIDL